MDARADKRPINPGAARVKRRLLASRSRIDRDGRALTAALAVEPVGSQPRPDAVAAIAALSAQLAKLHADVLHQTGGGAQGRKARQLTAQTIADARSCLAKLTAASKAPDQASAVKLISDGLKLVEDVKRTSRKAGKALEGSWPL